MPATLLLRLVFDVHRGRAELDERLHGARDVEGAAPAGIDVDQQRHAADVGDAADVGEHVIERADAEIGQAERAGRDTAAGEVDGAETDALGQSRRIGVDGAGDLERFFLRERIAKARARRRALGARGSRRIIHDGDSVIWTNCDGQRPQDARHHSTGPDSSATVRAVA